MFFRIEKSSERVHAQVVESKRVNATVRQTVVDNLVAYQ
jgi:hypothetical protein